MKQFPDLSPTPDVVFCPNCQHPLSETEIGSRRMVQGDLIDDLRTVLECRNPQEDCNIHLFPQTSEFPY